MKEITRNGKVYEFVEYNDIPGSNCLNACEYCDLQPSKTNQECPHRLCRFGLFKLKTLPLRLKLKSCDLKHV